MLVMRLKGEGKYWERAEGNDRGNSPRLRKRADVTMKIGWQGDSKEVR